MFIKDENYGKINREVRAMSKYSACGQLVRVKWMA